MNPERNKQSVIDAWKAFASRDPQLVSAVFTDDAEWIAPNRYFKIFARRRTPS